MEASTSPVYSIIVAPLIDIFSRWDKEVLEVRANGPRLPFEVSTQNIMFAFKSSMLVYLIGVVMAVSISAMSLDLAHSSWPSIFVLVFLNDVCRHRTRQAK
jgi:hypothetical protein